MFDGATSALINHFYRYRLIDVGFGDKLVPGPDLMHLPSLLDLPQPELLGVSLQSAIAEKFQAIVYLEEINSRQS